MNRQETELQELEKLADGNRLTRLLHSPGKYLYAMSLIHLFYPVTHRGSLKKADLFFGGEMEVLLPAATDIYLTGGKTHDSEIRLAKYIAANLDPGQHFLDIGAHFGYFTLLAASLVGEDGKVVAIEAAKGTYEVLSRNISDNPVIEALHSAVSDKKGTVSFYEFPVLYSEYNALDIEKFKQERWITDNPPVKTEVTATTIDDIILAEHLKPAIIKIDVEGAEEQAIAGGMKTWQEGYSTIIMEYLDEGDNTSYTSAADILYGVGYKSFMIDKYGKLVATDDILSSMRGNNISSENIVFIKG